MSMMTPICHNFSMDVLSIGIVSNLIKGFVGTHSRLFTGHVCKEWSMCVKSTDDTDVYSVCESVSRVKDAIEQGVHWDNLYFFNSAVSAGNLDVIQYLHSVFDDGSYMDKRTLYLACTDIYIMEWLLSIGCKWDDHTLEMSLVISKDVDVLIWLRHRGCPWGKEITEAAGSVGKIDIFDWLESEGFKFDQSVMDLSSMNGHICAMEWLKYRGCVLTVSTFYAACLSCEVPTISWLLSNGCPIDENSFSGAVFVDSLPTIQFLHSKNIPWNKKVFTSACRWGNLEIVKFLKNEGCPFSRDDALCAAVHGCQLGLLKWMKSEGWDTCRDDLALSIAYEIADSNIPGREDKIPIFRWIIENMILVDLEYIKRVSTLEFE